jgi:hypothetical protein
MGFIAMISPTSGIRIEIITYGFRDDKKILRVIFIPFYAVLGIRCG